MSVTAAQLISYFTAAADGVAPSGAETALLTAYAAQDTAGQISDATAIYDATQAPWIQATTDVAVASYAFFGGVMLTQAGLTYLVSPTGPNANNLNSAYYGSQTSNPIPFNQENRYYNFALALVGPTGQGQANFAATYSSLTLNQTIAQAYDTIIGDAVVGQATANAGIAYIQGEASYFAAIAASRAPAGLSLDLATKAVAIGFILDTAISGNVGIYAQGLDAFTAALANGTAVFSPASGPLSTFLSVYGPGTANIHTGVGQALPSITDGGGINEGGSASFTFTDNQFPTGTQLTAVLTGAGTSQVVGPLTGPVVLGAGANGATFTAGVATLGTVINHPGSAALTLTVYNGNTAIASDTIQINENATIAVANAGVVSEGSQATFAVTASSNVPVGTVETWTATGSGISQIQGATSGTVTIGTGGVASIVLNTIANNFEGTTPTVSISLTGLANTTATATINNNATVVVSDNAVAHTITQGAPVTFTINAQELGLADPGAAGVTLNYTLTDTNAGQLASPSSGTITFDNSGQAVVSASTLQTIINGAASGSLTLSIFNHGGAPIGSDTVTVNNSTETVTAPVGNVAEGSSVTFNIASNLAVGTVQSWTLSGAAIGNVTSATSGTVTIGAGGVASVTVNTAANDISGLIKGLTLSLTGVNNGSATASINENAPPTFVLTPGTDAGLPFTSTNTALTNNFYATSGGAAPTIGQNDVLTAGNGTSNILWITNSGAGFGPPTLLTNFTEAVQGTGTWIQDVQTTGALQIDESSAAGLTLFRDDNSLGSITLNTVTGASTGGLVGLKIITPTDAFGPVNLTVNYTAAVTSGLGSTSQALELSGVLGTISGLPDTTVTVPNVSTFAVTLDGSANLAGQASNGLTALVSNLLQTVAFTGSSSFVLGNVGGNPLAFQNSGVNTLNLSALSGVVYDLGNITAPNGSLTIVGGAGNVNSQFTPYVVGGTLKTGGNISASTGVTIQIAAGSFLGQQVSTTNGPISIQGVGPATGGFLSNIAQPTTISAGGSGSVSIATTTAFSGGLGGLNAVSSDNFSAGPSGFAVGSTITTITGAVKIGSSSSTTVTGGVNEDIITGTALGALNNSVGGAINVYLASGPNTVLVDRLVHAITGTTSGGLTTTVNISGGTNAVDFTQGPAGFEAYGNGSTTYYDVVNATGGTNTLVLNASHLGGAAGGVQTIDFYAGAMGANIDAALLDQGTQITQTLNVGVSGATMLEHLFSGDTVNLQNGSSTTQTVTLGVGAGGAPNSPNNLPGGWGNGTSNVVGATETLDVQGGDNITVAFQDVTAVSSVITNSIGTLNFGPEQAANTTLDLAAVPFLNTLNLTNPNNVTSDNVTIATASTPSGPIGGLNSVTLSTITGESNSAYNLRGLAGSTVTGQYGLPYAVGASGGDNNVATNYLLAGAGGTINLNGGAGGFVGLLPDQVAVGGGNWTITVNDSFWSSVVVNPGSTNTDTVNLGDANAYGYDAVFVGSVGQTVGGGAGTVDLTASSYYGYNAFVFDDTKNNQNWSSDTVHGGAGYNFIMFEANSGSYGNNGGGGVTLTDAGFANITGITEFDLSEGANSSLTLGANAAADANGSYGYLAVDTGGHGFSGFVSSTTIAETSAYTASLDVYLSGNLENNYWAGNWSGHGGDTGGDSITVGANSAGLSVYSTVDGFNTSFDGGASAASGGTEGIFGTNAANLNALYLYGSNAAGNGAIAYIGSNIQDVKTINGYGESASQNMGVYFASSTAPAANETVNLSMTGSMVVWGENVTSTGLTETAVGNNSYTEYTNGTATLIGASAAGNVLTAQGGQNNVGWLSLNVPNAYVLGTSQSSNFIYSPGGHAAMETGANGGANVPGGAYTNYDGTTFIFNNIFSESQAQLTYIGGSATPTTEVTITNFDAKTDLIALDLGVAGGITALPTFMGTGANFIQAESLLNGLTTSLAAPEAVYESDNHTLWISYDGDLDHFSAQIVLNISQGTFTSANFTGSIAGSGLSYAGGSVVYGTAPSVGPITLTIPIWNSLSPAGNVASLPGGTPTDNFTGAGGSITANVNFPNYNFSALSSGVTFTTPAFTGGAVMGPGTVTGTTSNDTFNVTDDDLAAGLVIAGGGGVDTLVLHDPAPAVPVLVIGSAFGVNPGSVTDTGLGVNGNVPITFGTSNAQVTGVQNLVLGTGLGVIEFNPGLSFQNVTGSSAGNQVHLANLVAGGLINMSAGGPSTLWIDPTGASSVVGDTITFNNGSANLLLVEDIGQIQTTKIDGGSGLSNTTIEITSTSQVDLSVDGQININTLLIASNGNVKLTGAEWNGLGQVKTGTEAVAGGPITAGNASATITFTGGETVTASTNLTYYSTYNLGNGTNTFTLVDNSALEDTQLINPPATPSSNYWVGTVNGGTGADTVNVGGLSLGFVDSVNIPGLATLALGAGANTIIAGNGAVFAAAGTGANATALWDAGISASGGGTVGLTLTGSGAVGVTMALNQYTLFESAPAVGSGHITNSGSASNDTITFATSDGSTASAAGAVLDANVQNWNLADGQNAFTVGSATQHVTAHNDAVSSTAINVGTGAFTGTLFLGADTAAGVWSFIDAQNTSDISGASITAGGNGVAINLYQAQAETVTMTSGEEVLFNANYTGAFSNSGFFASGGFGASDIINITDNGSTVVLGAGENAIGTFDLQHASTTATVSVGGGATGGYDGTLTLGTIVSSVLTAGTNNNDTINLNNGTPGVTTGTADNSHFVTINNFQVGNVSGTSDIIVLTMDGAHLSGENYLTAVTAASATSVNVIDPHHGSVATPTNIASVETELTPLATWANGNYAVGIADNSGNMWLYEVHAAGGAVTGAQVLAELTGAAPANTYAYNFQ